MNLQSFLAAAVLFPTLGIGGIAAANAAGPIGSGNGVMVGGEIVSTTESSFTIEIAVEHEKIVEKLAERGIENGEQIVVTFDEETKVRHQHEEEIGAFSVGDHVFVAGEYAEGSLDARVISDHASKKAIEHRKDRKERKERPHRPVTVLSIDIENNTVTVEGRDNSEKIVEYSDDATFVVETKVAEGDIQVGNRIRILRNN